MTLPPRPAGGFNGGGAPPAGAPDTGAGRGGFFRSPKVQAALKACGARFGFGRGLGQGRFRLGRQAINSYVACVRSHGFDMPNPNFSGKGPVFPASIRSNPKFQAASRACQNVLVRPGANSSATTSNA